MSEEFSTSFSSATLQITIQLSLKQWTIILSPLFFNDNNSCMTLTPFSSQNNMKEKHIFIVIIQERDIIPFMYEDCKENIPRSNLGELSNMGKFLVLQTTNTWSFI